MAFKNLIDIEFTAQEVADFNTAINMIETVLKGKTVNLTPQQRQEHGSIAERNKLFVNKAKTLMDQYPEHIPSFLDKHQFDRDYTARTFMQNGLIKLNGITEQISDSKTLLDKDNYSASLTYYRQVKLLSQENVPGTTILYASLRQFFKGGNYASNSSSEPTEAAPDTSPNE